MRDVFVSLAIGGLVGLVLDVTLALVLGLNVWMCIALFAVTYYAYAAWRYWQERRREDRNVPVTLEQASRRAMEIMLEQAEWNPLNTAQTAWQLAAITHSNLGRWMRNNWGLWSRNSKLYADIHGRFGLTHADDMSGLILLGAWHYHKGTDPHGDWSAATARYLEHWLEIEQLGRHS